MPVEITGVRRLDLHLLGHLRRHAGKLRPHAAQLGEVDAVIGEDLDRIAALAVEVDHDAVRARLVRRQRQSAHLFARRVDR